MNMNPSYWIWKLKYRHALSALDTLHNNDVYPGTPAGYLQMLRECPNLPLFNKEKNHQQRWYALAYIFSHNCKHEEHKEFWAFADKHTTTDFWRTYLDVKIKNTRLPHHQTPPISYQDKTWWQRWPMDMLASIAHSDHIHGGKSHNERPLTMDSISIMERELILSVWFGNQWETFKQSVFHAFLNLYAIPDTTAYDENHCDEAQGTKKLDYDPVVHFLRNLYSTYRYQENWVIEQCLAMQTVHKPPTWLDVVQQRKWVEKRYRLAIAALENYPEKSDRIDFALNFLQAKQTNLSANAQGYYALYGKLPNTESLEKSFPGEDIQSALAICDVIIDPERSLLTNFETAYHTHHLHTTAIPSAIAIEFETTT
jgi:hypothetical protein